MYGSDNKSDYRILIVDDETLIAQQIKRGLEKRGYAPANPVYSYDSAIAAAIEIQPELIIMDIGIPGEKNGIDLARAIRSDINFALIFMTGYSEPEIIADAEALDPHEILYKPVTVSMIAESIDDFFNTSSRDL